MTEKSAIVDNFLNGLSRLPDARQRAHPIRPVANDRNILITAALPYVNNVPHLGTMIGCVLSADVYSRFCRLRNYNVLYISGADEFGTATETKAIEEGVTPAELCDRYLAIHRDVYAWFNIDFDLFGRTNTDAHRTIAQGIFMRLHENGFLKQLESEQLVCTSCRRSLADRYVIGTCPLCGYDDARGDQCDRCGQLVNANKLIAPRCMVCSKQSPNSTATLELRPSSHLYLDLERLQPELEAWCDSAFVDERFSHNSVVISRSWLRTGLRERCVTRDLEWGTPVPVAGFEEKVLYVWFDAPIGYISITANYSPEHWREWWQPADERQRNDVELVQFLGKDNVPFHCIVFPATLIGTRDPYTTVQRMSVTEYLNYEGEKFSKSRGVGVFAHHARETGILADIWRFYLLFVRPEHQDSDFKWQDFAMRINTELLNNIGNFFNRSLSFLVRCFDGIIQEIQLDDCVESLLVDIAQELSAYHALMEKCDMRDAIRPILRISALGNQLIQATKPWELIANGPSTPEWSRAGSVISLACNMACLVALMLEPLMPAMMHEFLENQLRLPRERRYLALQFTRLLEAGHRIGQVTPLFRKISAEEEAELKQRFSGAATAQLTTPTAAVAVASEADIERARNLVMKQAELVRELKKPDSGADKAALAEEVKTLLQLKHTLAALTGETPGASTPGQKGSSAKKGAPQKKTKPPVKAKNIAEPESLAQVIEPVKQASDVAPTKLMYSLPVLNAEFTCEQLAYSGNMYAAPRFDIEPLAPCAIAAPAKANRTQVECPDKTVDDERLRAQLRDASTLATQIDSLRKGMLAVLRTVAD